jgi:hypothetical protein
MGAMGRLEASERMVVAIVSELAVRGALDEDLVLNDLNIDGELKQPQLFINAVQWLAREGVIASEMENSFLLDGTEVFGFILTSLGYQLLSQKFKGELTLGTAIKQVSETGKTYTSAGDFVGGLLGGFTKSISS